MEHTTETLPERRSYLTCSSCDDSFSVYDMFCADCGHYFCVTCLATIFTRAMANQSPFPPRCCQPFQLAQVSHLFDRHHRHDLLTQYLKKEAEYAVPIVERVYCHQCGTFILPLWITGDAASCPGPVAPGSDPCHDTCIFCKRKAHNDRSECQAGADEEQLEALAEIKGWQRCPGCDRLIELVDGCNHIS